MANEIILEPKLNTQDGHIILDTSEGLKFHAEFREEQDAKEYLFLKNMKMHKLIKDILIDYLAVLRYQKLISEDDKENAIEIIKRIQEKN